MKEDLDRLFTIDEKKLFVLHYESLGWTNSQQMNESRFYQMAPAIDIFK
jgi:hypothetical protein